MKRFAIAFITAILLTSCMSEKFLEGADYDDIEAVYNSVSFKTWKSPDKSNALIRLIQLGKTDEALLLIEKKAFKLNYANKNNETALSAALQIEDSEVVASLINHGASLDLNSPAIENPLFVAITAGNIKNIDLLLQNGSDINSVNSEGNNVLHYAVVSKNNTEVIPYLLKNNVPIEKQNTQGESPLFYAVKQGKIESAGVLIQNGADAHTKDKLKQNLYFAGAISGSPATLSFVHKYNTDINDTNEKSETPLLVAIARNDSKVVKELIKLGADIEKQTFTTPLWYALENSSNAVSACLQVLVESGVNLNSTDASGQTVLIKSAVNNSKELVSFFVNNNANLDLADSSEFRAVHYAIQSKNNEILSVLVAAGADLLVKNKNAPTLLHACVNENSTNMIDTLLDSKRISVDYQSSAGTTAAMQAYINCNGELANYLIQKGASLSAKDNKGKTLKNYRVSFYQDEITKANNQISTNNLTISVLEKDIVTAQNKLVSLRSELAVAQSNYDRAKMELEEGERKQRDIERDAQYYRNAMNRYEKDIYDWTQLYNSAETADAKSRRLGYLNDAKRNYNNAKRDYDRKNGEAIAVGLENVGKAIASAAASKEVSNVEKKIREQNTNISNNNSEILNLKSDNKILAQNIVYYQQEIAKY